MAANRRGRSRSFERAWLGIVLSKFRPSAEEGGDWKGLPCSRDMPPVGEGAGELLECVFRRSLDRPLQLSLLAVPCLAVTISDEGGRERVEKPANKQVVEELSQPQVRPMSSYCLVLLFSSKCRISAFVMAEKLRVRIK